MHVNLVAILDVGKTNAKVVVADPETGREIWSAAQSNAPLAGAPYLAIDATRIEGFLIDALARCPMRREIGTLVPVAHGAAIALVAGEDLALPILDYEEPRLDDVEDAYAGERPGFSSTLSPFLPRGLNLGRQLYFLETRYPREFASTDKLLLLPQYFAWALTGSPSCEVTSLGCHTDLWEPVAGRFSALATRRGWAEKFPRMRSASDSLGQIRPDIAARTGLSPDARVLVGIHDSNASFLRHRSGRTADEPFAVLSSGTWTIILASGVSLQGLDEQRDCLANVNAFGEPTATARFMGGREYAAIAGEQAATPTREALAGILRRNVMALPSFADGGGPFPGKSGRLLRGGNLSPQERAALATIYIALVADTSLDLLNAQGPLAVEGPLAKNPLFAPVLAAFRGDQTVFISSDHAGTVGGALCLADPTKRATPQMARVDPLQVAGLQDYRSAWKARVAERDEP